MNRLRIKQGPSLKQNPHFATNGLLSFLIALVKATTIVQDTARVGPDEPDDAFEQYTLARAAAADNQIGLALPQFTTDSFQYLLSPNALTIFLISIMAL